jgi:ferredoxin
MPYTINRDCTGKDTACVEACPFDCIHPKKAAFSARPLFFIDAEQCTDCGACALVCPESAIAPAAEFGRYVDISAPKKRTRRETHVSVVPTEEIPDEMTAYQIIFNEWVETFVASHV